MAYKTFVAGTEGLASDINTYLMNQTVMVFADATARDAALTAPTEGMVVYQTSNDHFLIYSGTEWVKFDIAWNAWTPTLTNLTQGTGAVTQAYYARIGKTVVAQVYVTLGTGPTVGGQFGISLPVNAASANRSLSIGTCFMRDSVGARSYSGTVFATTTEAKMQAFNSAGTYAYQVSQAAAVPHAWTSGDYFSFTITYQGV